MKKKKALVLFSGGLDSRIAAKLMQEQNFEVELCFVKLPFGGGCCNNLPCIFNFSQTQGYKLHIIDSTKDELFREYVELVRDPQYGYGTSMNPCKDCKIFIFKQGKKLAEEIDAEIIVTGEVIGQRPMSQMKKALLFDEEKADMVGKILRPLSAKLLPETEYEKNGLVDRSKLLDIQGRRREKQMNLAEKYKIKYPNPGGGCLLCEKIYGERLNALFEYNPEPSMEEIGLLKRGRMFKKEGLIFVGRNAEENKFIELINENLKWDLFFKKGIPGPTIISSDKKDSEMIEELWGVYASKDLELRKKFDEWKI